MASRLAIGLLCALLLAVGAGWAQAHADDPPLTLSLEADSEVCTAGSLTEVRWEISGGAEPYEATLNGQPVDTPSGATTAACGAALDVPDWLRSVVPLSPIDVDLVVGDESGAEARELLRLNRAPPLPAPVAAAGPEAGWTYLTTITASARGVGIGVEHIRRYLVRWRADEAEQWTYHTDVASGPREYDWVLDYETGLIGARVAVEVAQVRSFAEREKPDLLNWSETSYTATASPPTDLTARATHDTITVSWGPAVEGLAWTTSMWSAGNSNSDQRWLGASRSKWAEKVAGPVLPYEVTYDELLPDTLYHIRITLDDNCNSYGWNHELCTPNRYLAVRTAPPPPGWSRAPRRPQNVQATVQAGGGGILVTWDPPLEGEERIYAVVAHEYGAPRPNPVTPVGGVGGRSFVLQLPLDTTYEVIVRHLGVEDEEARVIWEPRSAQEWTETMTLPDWDVEHRDVEHHQPVYGDSDLGYSFTVLWGTHQEAESVQVRWLKDGYTMTRSAQDPPIIIRMTEPGPHPFQLRIRKRGDWSQWSSIQRASAKPPPPPSVEVRERDGMLQVFWTPPETWYRFHSWSPVHKLADQIDGFRAYLYRVGEPGRVLDVGLSASAEFPIPADGGEYEVHVAAYSETLGEGRAAVRAFSQATGITLDLSGIYWSRAWSLPCIPYLGVPRGVHWYAAADGVSVAIKIGEDPAFETTDYEGYAQVHCDLDDTGSEATDQSGIAQRNGDAAEQESAAAYWRGRVEGLALGRIYVEEDAFVLRWNRFIGSRATYTTSPLFPPFVVRWREVGEHTWHYRHAIDAGANTCQGDSRWTLEGLTPNTEYVVQIALDLVTFGVVDSGPLDWSEARFARTLPATIDANFRLEGSDVIVSWQAVPEAQVYVVQLEADGVRWTKRYEPAGGATERAVFADAAAAVGELQTDVTITSGISTDPGGVEIGDYAYCD